MCAIFELSKTLDFNIIQFAVIVTGTNDFIASVGGCTLGDIIVFAKSHTGSDVTKPVQGCPHWRHSPINVTKIRIGITDQTTDCGCFTVQNGEFWNRNWSRFLSTFRWYVLYNTFNIKTGLFLKDTGENDNKVSSVTYRHKLFSSSIVAFHCLVY